MMLRSRGMLRLAAALAAVSLMSACGGSDRPTPLSQVQPIEIPVADTTTRTNFNIDDPTLSIPATFPVRDLDPLTLVWSDEFDGAQLDPEVWFFESGDGSQYGIPGWGNSERQWYLPDNARLEDGKLKITARRETVGNFGFTSARINTRDRFAFKYGRIEASIQLPAGQGLWPAFWMLAQDSPYGDWPASGEIDILEAVNLGGFPGPGGIGGGNEIFGTLHFGGGALGRIIASTTYVPSTDVTADFHTYALEWDEFEIRWYYDGILYAVQNSWQSSAAPYPAPFDQPFYILLNLAVGGNFPGSPDGSTPFPATMEVDWVRVYSGQESVPEPSDPGVVPAAGVYVSDPGTMNEDLAPPGGIQNFGSGAVFVDDFSDPTFPRALRVTSGDGYGAEVGFAAFTGYAAGFAAGYETLHFKVKGDAANLSAFEVKFFAGPGEPETARTYDLTTYTDLGNGWRQVSIPTSDFSATLATNTGFLLGPQGDQGTRFSFLMTDVGFDPPGDGGGGDIVLVTFDEAVPPAVTEFGGAGYGIEPGPAGGDGNALRITRDGGDVFAGAWVAIPPIPNDAGTQTVSALVYSPLAGIPIVAKAEYGDNQGTGDVNANEAVVVGWQTLTWTFSNLAAPNEYNRFTILPNLGTSDVPAQIYYFDNITLLDPGNGG